jgi:serine/threonine-protein kinase
VTTSLSTLSAASHERLGTCLRGKYRVDSILGTGGMSVVFAVTHRNGRRFALKMLRPELSGRREFRERFLREGYIANVVGHPGAVTVLDDDVAEDGSAFLVMELLDGEGLDAVLLRNSVGLPPVAALSVAYRLLDVVAAAHSRRIVHRDLKPANLFITREGELKVLDFGIAQLHEPDCEAPTQSSGVTTGTPAFMAPEQARGRPSDARSDLYSVGATLFTLLSGRRVHDGENWQDQMVKAATEPARPMASIAPHLPRPVCAVIDRALAFTPESRWQTARSMRAAVESAHWSLTGAQLASLVVAGSRLPRDRPTAMPARASAETTLPEAGLASTIMRSGSRVGSCR